MNISISNICWAKERIIFLFLRHIKNNVYAVELALSCIWDEPTTISIDEIQWMKTQLDSRSISLVSLHSLTYTRPDLSLFKDSGSYIELASYIQSYISIARALDCPNLVFGSPKARLNYNNLGKDELDHQFISFLKHIDPLMEGVNFNIEPLSLNYTEYLNSFDECIDVLSCFSSKNIFIQLDLRTFIENNEPIPYEKINQYVRHVHVSNPGLCLPGNPYEHFHLQLSSLLKSVNYTGFITAEIVYDSLYAYPDFVQSISSAMEQYYG